MRNGCETKAPRSWNMKNLRLVSLVGITSLALLHTGWAAPHGGGGGGSGAGGFTSGGHSGSVQGAGVAGRGGGVAFGRPGFSAVPAYYYSRGMHYTNSRIGQVSSPVRHTPSVTRPDIRGSS